MNSNNLGSIEKRLLEDPQTSNRLIGAQLKLSDRTVAKVRRELETAARIPVVTHTRGSDGRLRPRKHSRQAVQPKSAVHSQAHSSRSLSWTFGNLPHHSDPVWAQAYCAKARGDCARRCPQCILKPPHGRPTDCFLLDPLHSSWLACSGPRQMTAPGALAIVHTSDTRIFEQIVDAAIHRALPFGGFVPVAVWCLTHLEPMQWWTWGMVAGGALFSSLTVISWGQIVLKNLFKAIGFATLVEGVMIASKTWWLSFTALAGLSDLTVENLVSHRKDTHHAALNRMPIAFPDH